MKVKVLSEEWVEAVGKAINNKTIRVIVFINLRVKYSAKMMTFGLLRSLYLLKMLPANS